MFLRHCPRQHFINWKPIIRVIATSIALAQAGTAFTANINHRKISDKMEAIIISGEIDNSDVKNFREIAVKYPESVVILNSNGGSLIPAIEIGKIIRISGFYTLVPPQAKCTSSCALIWVAGDKRFLSKTGMVGFHASYRDHNGRVEESGLGNALVGNYLTLLNFSQKAIIFATTASPDKIFWLNRANQSVADISFEDFDLPAPKDSAPPPIQTVRTPPPVFNPAPPKASSDVQWIEYASTSAGTVFYYDLSSVKRTSGRISVWILADYSKNAKVAHRSSKDLYEYDCPNQTSRSKISIDYDSSGSVIRSSSLSPYASFEPLVPETVGMALWQEICQ
ncbi:hypothetical protein Q4610_02405 [Sphingobium sp. HBC34]|uniref:Surface-adhesin protein E-like domain-containing protein n=1 Tax=Sphingobium cyanobacteriorum TaxID=3063954 RepID=A0ABT8ZI67_9SPHN|nr:surface-adhesin E family protein [Sphingobium sp. HBC34]MDO7833887.1 hypothetical protein [Sphingobium sp. HBC34]